MRNKLAHNLDPPGIEKNILEFINAAHFINETHNIDNVEGLNNKLLWCLTALTARLNGGYFALVDLPVSYSVGKSIEKSNAP